MQPQQQSEPAVTQPVATRPPTIRNDDWALGTRSWWRFGESLIIGVLLLLLLLLLHERFPDVFCMQENWHSKSPPHTAESREKRCRTRYEAGFADPEEDQNRRRTFQRESNGPLTGTSAWRISSLSSAFSPILILEVSLKTRTRKCNIFLALDGKLFSCSWIDKQHLFQQQIKKNG